MDNPVNAAFVSGFGPVIYEEPGSSHRRNSSVSDEGERRLSDVGEDGNEDGAFTATAAPRQSFNTTRTFNTTRSSLFREHINSDPNIPSYSPPENYTLDEETKTITGPQDSGSSPNNGKSLRDKFDTLWLLEISAALLSLGCMAVVIWVLVTLKDQPLSKWSLSIKPNSFVSVFITLSKFLMLIGVIEGISQLRWLYYQSAPRRLDALESFDAASRGPLGGLCFLWRVGLRERAGLIASWGAIIIIVALAMDPFAQQILSFPIRTVHVQGGGAWMPATNVYDGDSSILFDDSMRRAIYGGLLNFDTSIDYGCSTGNCTWQDFSSLGVCSSCMDVASTATKTCLEDQGVLGVNCTQIEYTTPESNLTIVLQNGSLPVSTTNKTKDSKRYSFIKSVVSSSHPRGIQDPQLFDFAVAQLLVGTSGFTYDSDDLDDPSWNITACAVSWCAKVYEDSEVANGALRDNSPRTASLTALSNSSCWDSSNCQEFTPANSSALPAGSNTTFYIGVGNDSVSIRNLMAFDYNITVYNNSISDSAMDGAYNLASVMLWNTNITAAFTHISTSMTNYLRSTSSSYHVNGTANERVTFVAVSWGWFAPPAAMVLMAIFFLMTVIVLSAIGVGGEKFVWKSSTLPLLLHGLQGWDNQGHAHTRDGMEKQANGMTGQLRRNSKGTIGFVKN